MDTLVINFREWYKRPNTANPLYFWCLVLILMGCFAGAIDIINPHSALKRDTAVKAWIAADKGGLVHRPQCDNSAPNEQRCEVECTDSERRRFIATVKIHWDNEQKWTVQSVYYDRIQ